MMTARERLLKRGPKKISVEGETAYIVSMTLREAIHAESLAKSDGELGRYVISRCVVDEDGQRIFADDDEAILDIPADKMRVLVMAIVNATHPKDPEAASQAIEKNSEATIDCAA
jgi:hypothetical protein